MNMLWEGEEVKPSINTGGSCNNGGGWAKEVFRFLSLILFMVFDDTSRRDFMYILAVKVGG